MEKIRLKTMSLAKNTYETNKTANARNQLENKKGREILDLRITKQGNNFRERYN